VMVVRVRVEGKGGAIDASPSINTQVGNGLGVGTAGAMKMASRSVVSSSDLQCMIFEVTLRSNAFFRSSLWWVIWVSLVALSGRLNSA
jgi:hypothetical protein